MRILALDFETYYDKDVSLKKLNTMEYVNHAKFKVMGCAAYFIEDSTPEHIALIEPTDTQPDWYNEEETEEFLRTVDWDNTAVLYHHVNFDAYILAQVYGIKPAWHYDTMAMSRGRFPSQSASLGALAERLFPDDRSLRKGTELASAKGIDTYSPELDRIIGAYACNDVYVMVAAFQRLYPTYPASELQIIDIVTRMFTQSKFVLDRTATTKHRNDARDNAATKVIASGLDKKALGSNDQFAAYIRDVLKLEVPMKQGKNKPIPAFGKNDIAFQKLKAAHPEFLHIWEARAATKSRIDETRATRFLDGTNRDGTIPMPINYYAAHTGRFGGGEKLNPQNLKRGSNLRKALQAPEGYVVVVADKSQIEARLVAWLAGCDELTQAFRDGRDVYSEFASVIYNRPIAKSDTIERFVGKTCILGLGFGVGGVKLQVTLESGSQGPVVVITEVDARSIVSKYRSKYYHIPDLWKKLEQVQVWIQNPSYYGNQYGPMTAVKEGWMMPNGMVLQYPQASGLSFYDHRFKMHKKIWGGVLCENWIQSLARVDICTNMCAMDNYFREHPEIDGYVALQIHDEIICICREEYGQQVYDKMYQVMTTPPYWAPGIPLKAEGGFAKEYSK